MVYVATQLRQCDGLPDNQRVRGKVQQLLQCRPLVGRLIDEKTRFSQWFGIDRAFGIDEQDDTAHPVRILCCLARPMLQVNLLAADTRNAWRGWSAAVMLT